MQWSQRSYGKEHDKMKRSEHRWPMRRSSNGPAAPLRLLLAALFVAFLGLVTAPALASPASTSVKNDAVGELAKGNHEQDGHGHSGSATGETGNTLVPWLMIGAGIAGVVLAGVALHTSVAGRLVTGGVGLQVAGLGWDALSHARRGEPIGLLENTGHIVSLIGLAVVTLTALVVLIPQGLRRRAASTAHEHVST